MLIDATQTPPGGLSQGTVLRQRYKIVSRLGSGGFADVYKGQDLEIGRAIAIKVLRTIAVSRDPQEKRQALDRFKLEAQATASIDHPAVVTIFDVGHTPDHQPYIVMEWLEGQDLESWLRDHGPMPQAQLLALLIDALEGLGIGHQQGLVHKDLKPSNLFIHHPGTSRERLRLLDFGVARLQTSARQTETGKVMGTPQYLAPEYIKSQHVSPALDVYQMGLILVEALTGTPVVADDAPWHCAVIHSNGDLDIPASLQQSPLGPILDRALALDPADRFKDAADFAAALSKLSPKDHPPTPTPPSHTAPHTQPLRDPTPRLAKLGLLLAVAAIIALAITWKLSSNTTPTAPSTVTITPDRISPPTPPPAAAPPQPEAAKAVTVTVSVSPHQASITDTDGTELGSGTIPLTFVSKDDAPITIVAKHPGHASGRLTVHPTDPSPQRIVLKPLPSAKPAPRPAKPTPKPAPKGPVMEVIQ